MSLVVRRTGKVALLSIFMVVLLVSASRRRPVTPAPENVDLDLHRSFAVTDPAILDGFSFERVMRTLVERSGARGTTALSLYQQWFDTQNPKPGLAAPQGPHCDDFLINGTPALNGFTRRCPTPEGALAATDPFTRPDYTPVALINRFDMTPTDGSTCGQYRLIFARTAAKTPFDRVNLIFEPVLPNPRPSRGLAGCRPVAEFWAELSGVSSLSERRARLERFFFSGIADFPPVLHPDHLGAPSGGSIRALHYTGGAFAGPRFYQFRLQKDCSAAECTLTVQPDVLENTVVGRLFDGLNDSPIAQRFRQEFPRHVESLAARGVNRFFMNIPREFLTPESDPGGLNYAFFYDFAFIIGQVTPAGRRLNDDIKDELHRIGSTLTPLEIVKRAETQTCVGCHLPAGSIGGGDVFPRPVAPFEHVSANHRESGEGGGLRFAISPAMRNVFIPERMEILRRFLNEGRAPVHTNSIGEHSPKGSKVTLSGRPGPYSH